MGCRGACSGTRSTSHLCFSTDFGVCRAVSPTHSQSSLPGAAAGRLTLFLKELSSNTATVADGLALAVSVSTLVPSGIGSIRYGGNFCQLLIAATCLPLHYQRVTLFSPDSWCSSSPKTGKAMAKRFGCLFL